MSFELRLIENELRSGAALALPADGVARIVYVAHGSVVVDGSQYADDMAWFGSGRAAAVVTAGATGAALWRWELAPSGGAVAGLDGRARLKLGCKLVTPPFSGAGAASGPLLMRADSVAFPSGGCAYLHTHQGPGIRCLIEGGIRIDTEGHSTSYAPGGAWFESGVAPVFAQGAADRPTRFIRVMVLPAALKGKSSIAYVRPEDRDKPKSQSYKGYVDTVVEP